MPKYQVRNRRTKMVLGEVVVADPAKVLDALMETTGTSIDDVAQSLGTTLDEAKAALDIVEIEEPVVRHAVAKQAFKPLPRRRLFG